MKGGGGGGGGWVIFAGQALARMVENCWWENVMYPPTRRGVA